MAKINLKDTELLEKYKKKVDRWKKYFDHNYKSYNRDKKFLFKSTISGDMSATNNETGQPNIECNILEAFWSRQRGEFSKQEPSIYVNPDYNNPVNPQIADVIEDHLRHIEFELRRDGDAGEIYNDMGAGGFGVMKITTDYENEMSFKQEIKAARVIPDLCGFDVMAKEPHKGDGKICFEIFPMIKEEFEEKYPDIELGGVDFTRKGTSGYNWSYQNDKEKILLVCDLYEKKSKRVKIVRIAPTPFVQQNGIRQVLTMEQYKMLLEKWHELDVLEQEPQIVDERYTQQVTVTRYQFIDNQFISQPEETDYPGLPLIFFDGNSVMIREGDDQAVKQITRSYFWNAIGAQQLINVAMQSIGNEMENTMQHKLIVAKEAIPPEYLEAYTDYQTPNVIVHNAFLDKEGVSPGTVPLPPPREVMRQPMPPEFLQTLQFGFSLVQNILGSFDASLGINNNQLSGVAIVEGATQSNPTAMPLINNYMISFTQAMQMYVDMIPKYMVEERVLTGRDGEGKSQQYPVNGNNGINLKDGFGPGSLNVKVEAGPNFAIQKSKMLQQITAMAQAMPIFQEWVNSSSMLPKIIKLMDFSADDTFYDEAKQFAVQKQQQMQQEAQQKQQEMMNNPIMIKAQNERMNIQREGQKDQIQAHLGAVNAQLKTEEIVNERMGLQLKAKQAHEEGLVELDKHHTEQIRANADMAMKAIDMKHSHDIAKAQHAHKVQIDHATLHHKVIDTVLKQQPKDNLETD